MGEIKCLNKWDIQSKHIVTPDGIPEALYAGECRWAGGEHYVCYAIEGNVVDRVSAKNGKGWCENVSPNLNTQDRHAICLQLCGDRADPSVSVSSTAFCIPANPMSDCGQAVCIAIEGNGARPSHQGVGCNADGTMYTLNTIERHSVCYGVDCRNGCLNEEVTMALQAHNNGGFSINCTPPILRMNDE